jgi:hypothetical protein
MSTTIDGFELLRAIGQNGAAFPSLRVEINKTAPTLVKKHLKSSSMTIDGFRSTSSAIGSEVLSLILEDLNDKDLRGIAKKIDPHYADLATASEQLLRSHLHALAVAETEPAVKQGKAAKTKAPSATKAKTTAHWPESMAAKPSRRRNK